MNVYDKRNWIARMGKKYEKERLTKTDRGKQELSGF